MVRRVLAAGCVVAALASASADDMAPSPGAVVHLHRDERPARNDAEAITWGADGELYSSLESLASSLLAATRDAEKSRWRATVTAVRVLPRASGAARVAAAARPIADAADLAALRTSIADRDAFVEHRVEASGPCGATRHATDGASTAVRIHDDDDSAVGGSVVWGIAAAAESGLDVRIETAPSGDGRWRPHVVAVWSGSPDRARADWLVEEDVDRVRVPVFAADVVFDVRGGETAVLRAIDASGAARLVLVRIDGDAPDVPMVRDHEGAWLVAPVDLVRDPEGPTVWPVESGPPIHSDDEARAALLTPEACRTEWRQGAIGLFRAALLTGAATDGTGDDLRAGLALRRGAGAVEIARSAGPRVVLPAAPGTLFRAFAGTIETMRRNVSTIPACEDCLLVRTEVGVEA